MFQQNTFSEELRVFLYFENHLNNREAGKKKIASLVMGYSIALITLQGFPAANTPDGISFVTTLPAPITHPSPIVTPAVTVTFEASQQLFPIVMGLPYSS